MSTGMGSSYREAVPPGRSTAAYKETRLACDTKVLVSAVPGWQAPEKSEKGRKTESALSMHKSFLCPFGFYVFFTSVTERKNITAKSDYVLPGHVYFSLRPIERRRTTPSTDSLLTLPAPP